MPPKKKKRVDSQDPDRSPSPTRTVQRTGSPDPERGRSVSPPVLNSGPLITKNKRKLSTSPEDSQLKKRANVNENTTMPIEITPIATTTEAAELPRRPGELREGDEVTWEEDTMRGVITEFDHEGMALIRPTHVDGEEITPELLSVYTDGETGTTSVRPEVLRLLTAALEIKKVPSAGVDITHFFPGPMTASEYIKPNSGTDEIEITNHGLGSGIYGIADPTTEQRRDANVGGQRNEYPVHLTNPLYLQDNVHGTHVTELSKIMQRLATAFTKQQGVPKQASSVQAWLTGREELDTLAGKLMNVMKRVGNDLAKDQARNHVKAALENFFTDYYSQTTVAQPINFLLAGQLGYDGIYAKDTSNNSFGRGCVAYTVPGTVPKKVRIDQLL